MNCGKCEESMIPYFEKLLDPEARQEMERHLESCAACSEAAREHAELHHNLVKSGRALSPPPMENKVMTRIFRKQAFALRKGDQLRSRKLRRFAVIAAAAVLVIASMCYLGILLDWIEPHKERRDLTAKIDDWCLDDPAKVVALKNTQSLNDASVLWKANVSGNKNEVGVANCVIDGNSSTQNQQPSISHLPESGSAYIGPGDTVPPKHIGLGKNTAVPQEQDAHLIALGYGGPAQNTPLPNELLEKFKTIGYLGTSDVFTDEELKLLNAHTRGTNVHHIAGAEFGFSVGGAKDILNFRKNIEMGFLPAPTDVTYQGLYYDYYFDTGDDYRCDDLFYPSYCAAVTRDPFSGREEYYLTVGLNSGLKSMARKKLNLVIVLDVSGSMKDAIDRYHYDGKGNKNSEQEPKIEAAKKSLLSLVDHLEADDRFGMVIFSDQGRLAKPLRLIGETDMDSVRSHIQALTADGATNMSGGMRIATNLYNTIPKADPAEYENRIIFITDAMPNQGEYSAAGLFGLAEKNAQKRIHSTFVGIGVDFNSQLAEAVTKTRGANYYSAHSSEDFKKRMVDEFDFMVTPLVFDLALQLESGGYRIQKVYGSPMADEATGTLMKINTLFPSRRVAEQTRGGVVLLQLARKEAPTDDSIFVSAKYTDRNGKAHTSTRTIQFTAQEAERFDNTGIRKAVLLARYANVLKDWLIDARMKEITPTAHLQNRDDYVITPASGIMVPPAVSPALGQWERQSRPLKVNKAYQTLFGQFLTYFKGEQEAIGDDTLMQELKILAKLAGVDLEAAKMKELLGEQLDALGYGD